MDVLEAADLIQAGYDNGLDGHLAAAPLDHKGAQAYFLTDGSLVIPGTNELSDWRRYNLFLWSWQTVKMTGGYQFHSGFLHHASLVLDYVRDLNVKRVMGHSLGAASGQIVGTVLGVPTINFAAPKVSLWNKSYANEDKIINFNRADDRVGKVPRIGFRHLGRVEWLEPDGPHLGGDHALKYYKQVLELPKHAHLPQSWPAG